MHPFTHLHVHSQYSLLDGKASIPELVDKAIACGMRGLALTDHGNMYGIKEFYNYVKKKNKSLPDDQKITPIIGCEMYVALNGIESRTNTPDDKGAHLIVLAKNEKGYHNLIKLVSQAWTDGFYFRARTDHAHLEKYHEGLIICSACIAGEVPALYRDGRVEEAEKALLWHKEIFGDDYYLELQRHQTFKQNANTEAFELQSKINPWLIEMSRKHGIKLIATNDVHFTNEEDAEAHDRLICVSTNTLVNAPGRMNYSKQEWFKSTEEMAAIFSDVPEALENTWEILQKVENYSIDHSPIMPNFEIPEEFGTEASYRETITENQLFDEFTQDENGNVVLSQEDAEAKIKRLGGYDKLYRIKLEADYLEKLTWEGAERIYGKDMSDEVRERLKFELYIMKTMGFPGYFLIVQDFINVARRDLGVSVGPGRGSAAGSAAAYCLGITQVDPIKYDLLFERFLNPDRISLPDIDVDFDDDGRYEVLKYVTDKYGAEKVAHIVTYQTMAAKNAIKDVARVIGLPVAEANRLTKLVPDRLPEVDGKAPKINLKNVLKYHPPFAAEKDSPNPLVRETIEYATQLEGNVRGTGVHACGVIICRDDITDWVPVATATSADGTKDMTTQYEGSVIEDTGLIKMDFLGLKTLSIIKETLLNIKEARGIDLDIDHIPLDDPATFKLYCDGNTTSTFQFESAGMQQSLRKLQPSKFEDLIAMNALYRPGPMDYIPSFIARKHGEEPIEYDIPIMKKYLEETYGITVYQEQVMLLSRLLANFTRGESDVLRKAMGKKMIDKMNELKVKFIQGGTANGHAEATLNKIWADWEKFASYAFNKSHATCYSWVAYQTAYLKANYPAEYMAGTLSRNLAVSDKLKVIMAECKRMGLEVKNPDINESREKFSVSPSGVIRFGLGAVKGVGVNAVNAIISERKKNGPYKDIYDFVERVNLSACNRSAIENLALAGAFDNFGLDRELFVAKISDTTWTDLLVHYGQGIQNDKNSLQASLFDDFEDEIETNRPPMPVYEKWSLLELLEKEKELVTVYLSANPLDPYYMILNHECDTTLATLDDHEQPGEVLKLGGLVVSTEERMTKKGKPFGKVELEDYSGKYEFAFFGKDFDSVFPRFRKGDAVFIKGQIVPRMFREGEYEFKIGQVESLDRLKGEVANAITIQILPDFDDEKILNGLQELFSKEKCAKAREDGEVLGSVNLLLTDPETRYTYNCILKHKAPVTRELVEYLDMNGLKYKVSTEI